MADTWSTLNHTQVAGSDDTIAMVFSSGGSPVDISAWTFTYAALAIDTWTADTIDVANGSITKSDSGTGTTDMATIPIDSTDSDVDPGRYFQEILAVIAGSRVPLFRGDCRIFPKVVA